MRNEKKKTNEGQPRARFLPFSQKKRFTARASKKGPPELGFGGGGGGVVARARAQKVSSLLSSPSFDNE